MGKDGPGSQVVHSPSSSSISGRCKAGQHRQGHTDTRVHPHTAKSRWRGGEGRGATARHSASQGSHARPPGNTGEGAEGRGQAQRPERRETRIGPVRSYPPRPRARPPHAAPALSPRAATDVCVCVGARAGGGETEAGRGRALALVSAIGSEGDTRTLVGRSAVCGYNTSECITA